MELLWPGLLGQTKWHFARDYFNVFREPAFGRSDRLHIGECERPCELNYILTRTLMMRRRRCEVIEALPLLQLVELPLGDSGLVCSFASVALESLALPLTELISQVRAGTWDEGGF